MTQLCQWISDGNTVSQTYTKEVKLQNYKKISKSAVTLEIHLFRKDLCSHSDKQICVIKNYHYVVALTHRAQNQTSLTESKKQGKNEEGSKERTWREKGCEEGEEEEMEGESQAGAPWHQGSGRTDGWGKAVLSSLPLLVCRQGLPVPSAADIFPGNCTVLIASLFRLLLPWEVNIKGLPCCNCVSVSGIEGERQGRGKGQESNKYKKLPTSEEKGEIKVKGESCNSYFAKDKILSSKELKAGSQRHTCILMFTEYYSQMPRGQGTQVSIDG